MKQIIEWLETKFSRDSAAVETDDGHKPVESHKPPVNVPVQKIEANQETMTGSDPGAQDDTEFSSSREKGFDPYNTGPLDTSKWRESDSDE